MRFCRLLGERRMQALEDEAAASQEDLKGNETGQVKLWRDALDSELGDPLSSLDRRTSYLTLRVERDLAIAEGRMEAGLQGLEALGVTLSREEMDGGKQQSPVEGADARGAE